MKPSTNKPRTARRSWRLAGSPLRATSFWSSAPIRGQARRNGSNKAPGESSLDTNQSMSGREATARRFVLSLEISASIRWAVSDSSGVRSVNLPMYSSRHRSIADSSAPCRSAADSSRSEISASSRALFRRSSPDLTGKRYPALSHRVDADDKLSAAFPSEVRFDRPPRGHATRLFPPGIGSRGGRWRCSCHR